MKKRPLQKVEAGCGAASAVLRCAGASLRYGGAWGSNCTGEWGAKEPQKDIGKSSWRMAF